MKTQLRNSSLLLVLLVGFILSSCVLLSAETRRKIENVPGAYVFTEGVTAYPDQYEAATVHLEAHEYAEAEAIFQGLIDLEPDNVNGYIGLGTSLSLGGKLDAAVDAYSAALRTMPDSDDALVGLGSTYSMMGEYSKAEDYYTLALVKDFQNPNAHWGLAVVLDLQGQRAEAIEHLEWIIENAPDSSAAEFAKDILNQLR
jgi:tetratricopeptide (TPR) repeat protein